MCSFIFLFFLSTILKLSQGHSWVACTDYDGTITGQDFNLANCNGFIRGYYSYLFSGFEFGLDRGINYQPGAQGGDTSDRWCQRQFSALNAGTIDAAYASAQGRTWQKATYTVGEEITLIWPAKNHANYECFANIPDTVMRLYMTNSQTSISGDPQSLNTDWSLVIDWHAEATPPLTNNPGRDGVPFQNCPNFCDNTDRAVCFGKFTVPDVPASGVYTFMWYWGFNSENDLYTSCFEAQVDRANGGQPVPNPTRSPTPRPVTLSPTNVGETRSPTQSPTTQPTDTQVIGTTGSQTVLYLVQIPICVYDYSGNVQDVVDLGEETFGNNGNNDVFSSVDGTDLNFNVTWNVQLEVTDTTAVRAITTAGFSLCSDDLFNDATCVVGPPACGDLIVFRQVSAAFDRKLVVSFSFFIIIFSVFFV